METKAIENDGKRKRKIPLIGWWMRNAYPIFMLFSGFAIIVVISLIILSRTQGFRYWVSGYVLDIVNSQLVEGSKFEFDDIRLSYLLGLELSNTRVIIPGDTVFKCKEFHIGIKISPLFKNKIVVNEILLIDPNINLLRSKRDGLWNVERIFLPSADTSETGPLRWLVDLKNVKIMKGNFMIYDSTKILLHDGKFDPNHLKINDLNLALKGNFDLFKSKYKIKISRFGFNELNSGFALHNFKTDLIVDTNGADIKYMKAILKKSDINLRATVKNINIFSGKADIYKSIFKFDANCRNNNLEEILNIIPVKLALRGDIAYKISAAGTINNFDLNLNNLEFGNSTIELKGKIKNITKDKPALNITFGKSHINESNLNYIIAGLNIKGIPNFSEMDISKLSVDFENDSLFSGFEINSGLGELNGEAGINFKNKYRYSGNIKTKNLDISKIILNSSIKSNINSSTEFYGSGTKPEDIFLNIKMDMIQTMVHNYSFRKFVLRANTPEPGVIKFDTLWMSFLIGPDSLTDDNVRGQNERLSIKGIIDYKNINLPKYDLIIRTRNINPAKTLNTDMLPDFFNGQFSLKGEGIDPDLINCEAGIEVVKWKYKGRELKPQKLDLSIKRDEQNNKELNINSDFLKIKLNGSFNYSDLAKNIDYYTENLTKYFTRKLHLLFPTKIEDYSGNTMNTNEPVIQNNSDFNLEVNFNDEELVEQFFNYENFKVNLSFKLESHISPNLCSFDIKNLNISNFNIDDKTNSISVMPVDIDATISMKNNINNVSDPEISFNMKNKTTIKYNSLRINDVYSKFIFQNNNLELKAAGNVNEIFTVSTGLNALLDNNKVILTIDSLDFNYSNQLNLTAKDKIEITYSNDHFLINKFNMTGKQTGQIELSGEAGFEDFNNFKVRLMNCSISEILKFIPERDTDVADDIRGKLDSVQVILNGDYNNTDIDFSLSAGNIIINGNKLGNINANISHRKSKVSGVVELLNNNPNQLIKLMELKLVTIPLNLSINAEEKRFDENKPIELSFETQKFPLELFSPFVPGISRLRGLADIKLTVEGKNLKNIEYNGSAEYSNTSFLLEATNMNFFSDGKILFNTDTITIQKIKLINDRNDLSGGEATAKGNILLEKLTLKNMDIKVSSNKLKVLNQASMKSSPSLYGDFIIAFGPRPLHIYGSLEEPYIRGDINIVKASLTMPSSTSNGIKKSRFKYEIMPDKTVQFEFVPDSSINLIADKVKKDEEKSKFSDQLDIDVGIKFKGKFIVIMDMPALGQLYADVGTENQEEILRYVLQRGSVEPKIYGANILVKSGSTLKLIKMLETNGNISFPTGLVSNPTLDLTAVYHGSRILSNIPSQFIVTMHIKGTKENPLITFSYSIDDNEAAGDAAKINEDALLLLAFGKTKAEFTGGNGNQQSSVMGSSATNIASGFASSMASSALTDFVQATNFIQSADIDIGSTLTNLDQAKMKLSGEIYGYKWTLGGTVADFANNNEISIDIPLNTDIKIGFLTWLNSSIIQVTKSQNSSQSTVLKNQKEWELKFKLGSW